MALFKESISPALVACIADHLEKQLKGFDRLPFEAAITEALPKLELKERSQLIADHLHQVLPANLTRRNKVLRAMLHPCDDERASRQSDERGICGWGMFPLGMVVGQYGLDDFDASLLLLKDMTRRNTSELDVRHYLIADQARALAIMGEWVDDLDYHVRRLVSEGTRPRLPWAMQLPRLIADPTPTLPLLLALRDDPEEYVRRSVANHLNDIAKDHPGLVAELAKDWLKDSGPVREKLVRHACRTLIKQGHPGALLAFGLGEPKLTLTQLDIETKTVALGDALVFSAQLRSSSRAVQSLVVDYILHFKKANGKQVGKVFKWKRVTLAAGEVLTLRRSHAIRPITTRRYYAGRQALSLRINGRDFGRAAFTLNVDA